MFKRLKWRVSPTALDQAGKILGLNHPVSVTTKKYKDGGWWGMYRVSPLHNVWMNPSTPVKEVSLTLWHELGHAMQCDRDFNSDGQAYLAYTAVSYSSFVDHKGRLLWDPEEEEWEDWYKRYMTMPMEREAEDIATKYAKRYPLIV